jgi:hypothetical protein
MKQSQDRNKEINLKKKETMQRDEEVYRYTIKERKGKAWISISKYLLIMQFKKL